MTPPPITAEPFLDVAEESLDEAAFLWRRWEADLSSFDRNLEQVSSWTEDRLHGALDGIRAAGARALELAGAGLASDEPARISACAGVLASNADRRAAEPVLAALAAASGPRLEGLVRGLELLGSDHALRAAAPVLGEGGPAHAAALCRLKAFRRAPAGDEMVAAWVSDVPAVQAEAIRSALNLPQERAEEWISEALRSDDPAVQLAAVESGLCLGIENALQGAVRAARHLDADAGPYLRLLAMLGTPDDHEFVYAALRKPDLQPHAIWALGHIGTARAVDACLVGMQHANVARAAAEAYCWITGADLIRDGLAAPDTPAPVPAFEDDDLDADLVPAPEELWPLPDADAVARHWRERQPALAADVRYLRGRPATQDTMLVAVETGPMRRRPDLILRLQAQSAGRYNVEPRAFVARQRRMMTRGRHAIAARHGA